MTDAGLWRTPARHCTALTKEGHTCRAAPLREGGLCFMHDPEHAAAAAEARQLGGLRRRREGTIKAVFDLESLATADGLRRVLEIAVSDALGLDQGVSRVRVLIAAIAVAARLLETAEFERRLSALEAAARTGGDQPLPDPNDRGLLGIRSR